MLLAVPRVRGHSPKATLVERYVLDSLGRSIDPGPALHKTVESVNLLAEVLLTRNQLELENAAASALCNTECFARSGPHVFTPDCTGKMAIDTHTLHRSVSLTRELSLGELLLLNAIRLRMRTLPYSNIADHAVPMLIEKLALPRIEALLDALLLECLQYGADVPDIRCLCSQVLSLGESRFLTAIVAFGTGESDLIASQLNAWLPLASVQRL